MELRSLRCGLWIAVMALAGCQEPDDTLFTAPALEPVEQGGRFRVTFNPGPDVTRGFTPDGARIVYRSRGLGGFGDEWRLLSSPIDGVGAVREEAELYRAAVEDGPVGHITFDANGRTLSIWRPSIEGFHWCGPPTPVGPEVTELVLLRLGPEDGLPISSISMHSIIPPIVFLASTLGAELKRVRLTPAEQLVRTLGANPFGPVVAPTGDDIAYVSDGDNIWRVVLTDPAAPRELVGQGAFPALAPDGSLLAVALPTGVDSSMAVDTLVLGLGLCIQETVTISATGWQTMVYDLAADSSWVVTAGRYPQFDPSGTRLLVRRGDGLHWITLASGTEALVPGTSGAYAPSVSSDGSIVAFSLVGAAGPDVYFVRLN
jgi:hypothetical protein